MNRLTYVLALVSWAATLTAQDELTLREAISEALQAHPAIEQAEAGQDAAAARLKQAEAGRLPFLRFSETYVNSNNPVFAFGKKLEQARFSQSDFALDSLNSPGSLNNFRSALELRIPVFQRWRIDAGIEQAKSGRGIAQQERRNAEQRVRFGVIRGYYGVLLAQARLEVAREAVATAEAELRQTRDRFEQGMVVASDVMALEVQLAEFQQQRIEAAGDVETAFASLNVALGRVVGGRPRLAGRLEPRDFQIEELNQLIEQATGNHPELRTLEREAEIQRQKVRKARGDYLPDLGLFAEFGHSGQDFSSGSADFSVGARLNFDILDFGRPARIAEAQAGLRGVEARRRQVEQGISLEVVRAFENFRAARKRLQVADSAVGQAGETLRIVEDRHREGLTDVTETLRAQTALVRARTNRLAARYGVYVGYAAVLLSAGRLDDVGDFE